MNLAAIHGSLARRIGTNHAIELANGTPKLVHVLGRPNSFYEVQQAIAAINEVEPNSRIDVEPALNHLRNK